MARDSAPEDKLLRLIKGKYKKKQEAPQVVMPEKSQFLKNAAKDVLLKNSIFKPSFLRTFNIVLLAIFIVVGIYFINVVFFSSEKEIPRNFAADNIDGKEKLAYQGGQVRVTPEDYSEISKWMAAKKLFTAPFMEEKSDKESEVDISKRFSLVGIIAGENPQAIVEDNETKKTYYLYEDQGFGDVIVKDFGEGRVVLSYKGREIILVL